MFAAQSLSELPNRDEILSMSGLEFMQRILNGDISRQQISEMLNDKLEAVESV